MIQGYDVIIIGGGLFGQVIAKTLEKVNNKSVLVIDGSQQGKGSLAAACLMKPSWASSMSRSDFDQALELLEHLYGYEVVPFKLNGLATVDLFWVPPYRILNSGYTYCDDVVKIERGAPNEWLVHVKNHPVFNAKQVIVAAGKWTNDVLSTVAPKVELVPKLTSKVGTAFVGKGSCAPKIKVWAPYKQLVAFNRAPDQIWVGDGTALKPESLTVQRALESERRCAEFADKGVGDLHAITGHRPYADIGNNPCYLKEHAAGLWVATGGAKNGTLGAAWCARKLL